MCGYLFVQYWEVDLLSWGPVSWILYAHVRVSVFPCVCTAALSYVQSENGCPLSTLRRWSPRSIVVKDMSLEGSVLAGNILLFP